MDILVVLVTVALLIVLWPVIKAYALLILFVLVLYFLLTRRPWEPRV